MIPADISRKAASGDDLAAQVLELEEKLAIMMTKHERLAALYLLKDQHFKEHIRAQSALIEEVFDTVHYYCDQSNAIFSGRNPNIVPPPRIRPREDPTDLTGAIFVAIADYIAACNQTTRADAIDAMIAGADNPAALESLARRYGLIGVSPRRKGGRPRKRPMP